MFTIHGLSEWHELELARLPDDAASLPEPACPGTLSCESRGQSWRPTSSCRTRGARSRSAVAWCGESVPRKRIAAASLGSELSLVESECMVSMMMLNQLSRSNTTTLASKEGGRSAVQCELQLRLRMASPDAARACGCIQPSRWKLDMAQTGCHPESTPAFRSNSSRAHVIGSSPPPFVSGAAAAAAAHASELPRQAQQGSAESSPCCSWKFAWQSNVFSRIRSEYASCTSGPVRTPCRNHGSAYVDMCPPWPRPCGESDLLACLPALHPRTRSA